jgi:hypothetical protein
MSHIITIYENFVMSYEFLVFLGRANRHGIYPFKWEKEPVNIVIIRSFIDRAWKLHNYDSDIRKPQNWSFQKFWWRYENQRLKKFIKN